MKSIFFSWIGDHDLNFVSKNGTNGPIIALFESEFKNDFDEIHLLHDHHRRDDAEKYMEYIKKNFKYKKHFHYCDLKDPANYNEIYKHVKGIIEETIGGSAKNEFQFHFHTSPGTSQMSSIWLLLAKTIYPAVLYQSYYNQSANTQHVRIADIPFNIDMEYLPDLKKAADERLIKNWDNMPEFKAIKYKSQIMTELVKDAAKIANHDIPVLILGETGTGKELFAKFIHSVSARSKNKFMVLNCSAIQETTANATLFGWSKGAWTGSVGEGEGLFKQCHNGTIFLDEIGDLSLETQTKILRTLQEGEIQRVGDSRVSRVNVRIIAATNKDLFKMISEGKFREDLFFRINVGKIDLPPLRERGDDALLIAQGFLKEINLKFSQDHLVYTYNDKKFSMDTKKFILKYEWPGNVRELYHTIERACIWSDSDIITEESFKKAVTKFKKAPENLPAAANFQTPLKPFNLAEKINEIKKKIISETFERTGGNKSKTAELLGYNNYQTLSYDIKTLGIEPK